MAKSTIVGAKELVKFMTQFQENAYAPK